MMIIKFNLLIHLLTSINQTGNNLLIKNQLRKAVAMKFNWNKFSNIHSNRNDKVKLK